VTSPASPAITPRITRLLRVPGLRALQRAVAASARSAVGHGAAAAPSADADLQDLQDTLVLVPSEGAADQLRQTLRWLWSRDADVAALAAPAAAASAAAERVGMPSIVTRGGLYAHLAQRLVEAPPMLDELAREVLFRRAADAAVEQGHAPPFEVRPGLIPEMLALYDALRRQHRTIDDFERLVGGALAAGADIDRGARRLLQQTQFLVAAFRAYEASLDGVGALDEHGLRARLLAEPAARPLRKIIVCVPDVRADAAGLWPADFDLLTRLPELAAIDLVATERLLATGYLERLLETLPEIEVLNAASDAGAHAHADADADTRPPVLLAPPPTPRQDALHFTSRDREEELAMIASSLRAGVQNGTNETSPVMASAEGIAGAADVARRVAALERTAVVYQRPLPYLYLARQVFGAHGVPWQAMDALPLAAEPYAAALDLVLTFVASGYTRNAGLALLRSPHFRIIGDGHDTPPRPADIAACDTALREADYLGGRERLAEIVSTWQRKHADSDASGPDATAHEMRHTHPRHTAGSLRALMAMLAAAEALAPLEEEALPSAHLATLEQFLLRHERLPLEEDAIAQRHLRAREAMLGTIRGLQRAFLQHGERPGPFRDVAALVHRWLEGLTFNPRVGTSGVHLVDVPAAMFGRFARVAFVGVLEGEWPSASSRNIFYPSSLLRDLSWPAEAERRTAARATFEDLLHLASDEVMVSVCALENDSIVRPSPFVEDLASAGLDVQRHEPERERAMTSLTVPAMESGSGAEEAMAWAALRAGRSDARGREYHGWTGAIPPRAYSVTGIDRYLQCPFKYFAGSVLRLDEELDEQPGLTPLERGRFEHEVFQEFFARWHGAGHGAIDEEQLDAARTLFATVVEDMLPRLPFAEREIERTRLLGSAVSAGLGERIFRFEAARPLPIVERLIEFKLDGEYDLPPAPAPKSSSEGEDEVEGAEPSEVEANAERASVKRVRLRGVADRIDLLADGSLRLIDYKTGKGSGVNRTIQLPVYAFAAEQRLAEDRGRRWRIGEAGYLAFGRTDPYILAIGASDDPARVVNPAVAKLRGAVDRIEEGEFQVTPVEPYRCVFCGYAAVCRKDYVGDS
jgi:RecB family exonuclease